MDRMKVLLLNGSPNRQGCTYTALAEVARALEGAAVKADIVHVGAGAVQGCAGCGGCSKTGLCVFDGDAVNLILPTLEEYDGFVFGTPVHYAAPAGALACVLDRLFTAAAPKLAYKPGAAVASCRRGGASASFDALNKYFTINNMPVVASQYWNSVHGSAPEETRRDEEGLQTMRLLGQNMAWLLQSIAAGRAAGVVQPVREERIWTSFIR